jgi:hypothetical protein
MKRTEFVRAVVVFGSCGRGVDAEIGFEGGGVGGVEGGRCWDCFGCGGKPGCGQLSGIGAMGS